MNFFDMVTSLGIAGLLFAAFVWSYKRNIEFYWVFAIAFLMVSCRSVGIH